MSKSILIRLSTVILASAVLSVMVLESQRGPEVPVTLLRRKDRTIALRPSTRFAAYRLREGVNLLNVQEAFAASGIARGSWFSTGVLARKGLLIVAQTAAFQASAAKLRDSALRGAAPLAVFSAGTIDLVETDDLLVKFTSDATSADRSRLLEAVGGTVSEVRVVGPSFARVRPGQSAIDAANALNLDVRVEYAEPDFVAIFRPRPRVPPGGPPSAPASAVKVVPTDPFFRFQWALKNRATAGADIHIEPAWKAVTVTNTVTVAVLDEGVDSTHPDLKTKIVGAFDATATDPKQATKQDPNPWDGHGTASAGIVAAQTNNAVGIAAAGYDVKLMPIRIASTEKPVDPLTPSPWVTTLGIIAEGIRKAVDAGAAVLNNSWSGGDDGVSVAVEDALKYAVTSARSGKGAVVVFSVGNYGGPVEWPATLASKLPLIAVAATNEWDEIKTAKSKDSENWWASNLGPEVTVAAPGVHILTTDNQGDGGFARGSDYTRNFNGTSSAAPHVAGVAALLVAQHPDWTAAQIRDRIRTTADPLVMPDDPKKPAGFGRVNACKAVGASPC